jgi:sporulation protein YlmC with PRC-barrel domain
MNLTTIIGRPVLDLSTATTIGRVDDVVVDASERRVVGFLLGKVTGTATWLTWDVMTALGADAITVGSVGELQSAPDGVSGVKSAKVLGGRVLTSEGRQVAALVDFDLDPGTGAVTALSLGDRTLPGEALLGIGSYATIVTDPDG